MDISRIFTNKAVHNSHDNSMENQNALELQIQVAEKYFFNKTSFISKAKING